MDPLDALIRLAFEEGALTRETLPEFARALRERAELILGERVAGLEAEISWRKTTLDGLETQVAWLRQRVAQLEADNAWRQQAGEAARLEAMETRALLDNTRTAHDRLLDHHRTLLRDLVARLQGLGTGRIWRLVRLQRQLRELAASLSGEGS